MTRPVLAASSDFEPRTGYVYGLVASNEPERIRYIGSTWEPRTRLLVHLSKPSAAVGAWVAAARAAGYAVVMVALDSATSRDRLYDLETRHLREAWARGEADLTMYGHNGVKRPGRFG